MNALRLNKANDFVVEHMDLPKIGKNEILIKVKCVAICGTDIRILEGKKTKDVKYPSTIGHEISGQIYKVGCDVKELKEGDRVAVANVVSCHTCSACITGHENVCMNRIALGYEYDGGFAEYMLIPEVFLKNGNILKMPDSMTYSEGALVEPTACCIRGQKNADVKFGDKVLIIGAGPIGLIHTMLAKAKGVAKVVVVEPSSKRRQMAEQVGADMVFDSITGQNKNAILEMTDGLGCDIIIMAAGINGIINDAINLCKKGGCLNLFAGFAKGAMSEVDVNKIHYGEINVNGSSAYKLSDYLESFEMIADKKIEIDKLVTHRFRLIDFVKAYNVCKEGSGLKVIIEP